jgi:CRP-like cAMP-binding protein/formate hydrogenlyase subunit 6/NADH:ubiquinone oxidoreductase subunit I
MSDYRDEEAPTSRGPDDELIRYELPDRTQYEQQVTLKIDGKWVRVPVAVPSRDDQGLIRRDLDGMTIPRFTTLYDAAAVRFQDEPDELAHRIPVLCHQEHTDPVAVCRVCSVQVHQLGKGGKVKRGRKLLPACKHRAYLKEGVSLEVFTQGWPGREADGVRQCLPTLVELLLADHRHAGQPQEGQYGNELQALADTLGVSKRRFLPVAPVPRNLPQPGERALPQERVTHPHPYSSDLVAVDHDNCILCDRCVRACTDVRSYKIIGHTGKGYRTRISFDLDQVMGQSNCFHCGECMVACPTGTLTFVRGVYADTLQKQRAEADHHQVAPHEVISAEDLQRLTFAYNGEPVRLFQNIPFNFLKWNEGAVVRRHCQKDEILCRQGESGSTAFLIEEGAFEIRRKRSGETVGPPLENPGFLARLLGHRGAARRSAEEVPLLCKDDAEAEAWFGPVIPDGIRTPKHLIVGEFACLRNIDRTATLRATTAARVLVLRRNLLHVLFRRHELRDLIDGIYCQRAIESCLRQSSLFAALTDVERERILDRLLKLVPAPRLGHAQAVPDPLAGSDSEHPIVAPEDRWWERPVALWRAAPGQRIVKQGDQADGFYIVWLGAVKVSRQAGADEVVIDHLKAERHFGEIALLAEAASSGSSPDLPAAARRTSSCTALDHVELVRIRGKEFKEICLGLGDREEYSDLRDIQGKIRYQVEQAAEELMERNRRLR